MKFFSLFIAIVITIAAKAQTALQFDKRFVECEDKWVAFQPGKDSTQVYGFIYIDAMAGLTLNVEGSFTTGPGGKFIPGKMLENGIYKVRLEPNNVKVALIPSSRFEELNIQDPPDWLHNYKQTKDTIGRMVRWGYYYNHWDESAKALTYLEKAYQLDPKYNGLEFELSYAYNALGQFDKAIVVLKEAIRTSPEECLFYKELSFAEIQLGQLDKAALSCRKGIDICPDKQMKTEIAYNLAYNHYKVKDKEQFKIWVAEAKKWGTEGDQFMKSIKRMEDDLLK